jgi:hypothetical protein
MSEVPPTRILLVPAPSCSGLLTTRCPLGGRPPTAYLRRRAAVVHEEYWGNTSCPVPLCKACAQPWPCDTPGAVESPEVSEWLPGAFSSLHAVVLAWDGKPVYAGCDWADRARHGLETASSPLDPRSCAPAVRSALLDGGPALQWLRDHFCRLGTIHAETAP